MTNYSHYQIYLNIDPQNQFIKCEIELKFLVPDDETKQLSFYLHREFTLQSVESEFIDSVAFDLSTKSPYPFIPDGVPIYLKLSRIFNAGEEIQVSFSYEGRIESWPEWSANVITEEWTELGLYFPWFPYNAAYGEFTYSLEVNCDPRYHVQSIGERHTDHDQNSFSCLESRQDIVIFVSPDLKTKTNLHDSQKITVHSVQLSDSTVENMMNDLESILSYYQKWFGTQAQNKLTVVESQRKKGGGYTRKGLIVLGGLNDQQYLDKHEAYIRYLGHEVAHLWWFLADTNSWEDWLNESFAEYSALLAVREMFGQAAFDRRLSDKEAQAASAGCLWGVDRADYSTQEAMQNIEKLLYARGPILLYRLFEKIGEAAFFSLCKEITAKKIATTENLLDLLRTHIDAETANCFEGDLKNVD